MVLSCLPRAVPPWCLTGCPISPFLPLWCLPGASQAVQLILSCLPGASPRGKRETYGRTGSPLPGASQAVQLVLSASLVPPRLSKWSFPASLVPPGASQAVQMVLSCLPGASQPCLGRLLESSGLFGLLAPPLPGGVSKWSFNGTWLSSG